MSRKRITELMPFLLPLRVKQKQFTYFTKMKFDHNTYAKSTGEYLSETISSTTTNTINHNSGFDIKYQYNKEYNLKLIAKKLDGLLIKPNEIFSFCYAIKDADKINKYLDGLVVSNGVMTKEKGGGICQMSSQLYNSFLYTPLTIVERHAHKIDYFPPHDISQLAGIDATVNCGWLDLKVKNETNQTFQIKLVFDEGKMNIDILSDQTVEKTIIISNQDIKYEEKDNVVYKFFDVIKGIYDKKDLNSFKEELVSHDVIKLGYDVKEIL